MRPQLEALNARLVEASQRTSEAMEAHASEHGIEWPEPEEGDYYGPDEPLFSSRRGYLEQLARYCAFQGKGPIPDKGD